MYFHGDPPLSVDANSVATHLCFFGIGTPWSREHFAFQRAVYSQWRFAIAGMSLARLEMSSSDACFYRGKWLVNAAI
jgi:hypothetical protein